MLPTRNLIKQIKHQNTKEGSAPSLPFLAAVLEEESLPLRKILPRIWCALLGVDTADPN